VEKKPKIMRQNSKRNRDYGRGKSICIDRRKARKVKNVGGKDHVLDNPIVERKSKVEIQKNIIFFQIQISII